MSEIVGYENQQRLKFILGDVTKRADLLTAFGEGKDAVIHFAGLKAVGESKEKPLRKSLNFFRFVKFDSTFFELWIAIIGSIKAVRVIFWK